MLVFRPLCQKPPSPITEIGFLSALTLKAEDDAGPSPYPMVVPPMLNGGRLANRWQPISPAIWCGPSSCCTSFMAAKIGRSGHPMQKLGGRGGSAFTISMTLGSARTADASGGGGGELPSKFLPCSSRNALMPLVTTCGVYSPAIGNTSLPLILV